MKKFYIYSTMTNDNDYITWEKGVEGQRNIAKHIVRIKGGANRADDQGGTKKIFTPLGAVTPVTEEDMEHLSANEVFLRHQKNGFITVRDSEVHPEVAASEGMKQKDASAPYTPETIGDDLPNDVKVKEGAPEKTTPLQRMGFR